MWCDDLCALLCLAANNGCSPLRYQVCFTREIVALDRATHLCICSLSTTNETLYQTRETACLGMQKCREELTSGHEEHIIGSCIDVSCACMKVKLDRNEVTHSNIFVNKLKQYLN